MDFNSFSFLDCGPLLFELLHHLFPHKKTFAGELVHALLSLLLEHEQAEGSLNDCRFLHQEFEVGIGDSRFVSAPIFLNNCCRQNGTLLSLEHQTWNFYLGLDIVFVDDAVVNFLLGRFSQVHVPTNERRNFPSLQVSHVNLSRGQVVNYVVQNERNGAPPIQMSPLERDEFRGRIKKLPLAENELMQRVNVHQLVIVSREGFSRGLGSFFCH